MNQKAELSITEKLFIIMAWKLNGMCQPAAYEGWNDHYSRQSNREFWSDSTRQLQGWKFGIDDLQQVNSRDLKFLGFRQWEDETSMLLPLWLYPHMKKGETWNSLWGESFELSDETDLDTRGGCLACWFRYEPVAVTETIDQMYNDRLEYQPTETDPNTLISDIEALNAIQKENEQAELESGCPWAGIKDGDPRIHYFTDEEAAKHIAEAEAWAAGMSGGEDDDELVIHPFRDDEHQ